MTATTLRRVLAVLSFVGALVVVGYLLFAAGLRFEWTRMFWAEERGLVFWIWLVLAVSMASATAAWTGHSGPIWMAAGVLTVLSWLAIGSIGYWIAPQALLLALVAAAVSAQRWLGWWLRLR
jgi:hypothetical protein